LTLFHFDNGLLFQDFPCASVRSMVIWRNSV